MINSINSFLPNVIIQAGCAGDEDFDRSMSDLRRRHGAELSASQMPTILKQRYTELEMIRHCLHLYQTGAVCRARLVERVLDNVENGPGHLSVNRAKQTIREIGKLIGFDNARNVLAVPRQNQHSCDALTAEHVAQILGWMKDDRAFQVLIAASSTHDEGVRQIVKSVLSRHYGHRAT